MTGLRFFDLCLRWAMFLMWIGTSAVAGAAQDASSPRFENEFLSMRLRPNTPDQIAAFYEARGFLETALEDLKAACFITVMIRNKSDMVIWLEPTRWRFVAKSGTVRRLNRDYWEDQWQSIGLPRRNRATFGWTQLSELRDLRPQEPVGGNVMLAWTDEPFTLEARLATGADKGGDEITSFFVDPEGRIRYLALGGRVWDTPPYLDFLRGLTSSEQ